MGFIEIGELLTTWILTTANQFKSGNLQIVKWNSSYLRANRLLNRESPLGFGNFFMGGNFGEGKRLLVANSKWIAFAYLQ